MSQIMCFHCRCAVFCQFNCKPDLVQRHVKRYREAFKETICHCRRKRTLNLRHNSVHQSYYSSTKNNKHAPGVSVIRRHDAITCDRNVVRSDTQQTHFILSASG